MGTDLLRDEILDLSVAGEYQKGKYRIMWWHGPLQDWGTACHRHPEADEKGDIIDSRFVEGQMQGHLFEHVHWQMWQGHLWGLILRREVRGSCGMDWCTWTQGRMRSRGMEVWTRCRVVSTWTGG